MRRIMTLLYTLAALFLMPLAGRLVPARAVAPSNTAGTLVVTFFETRLHGLAVAVQTPSRKTYLVDTGPRNNDYDAGRDTIAPWLKAQNITEVAGIALSHPHNDHFGGAAWLLENLTVKQLIDSGYDARGQTDDYRKLRQKVKERGGEYVVAHAGDALKWDEALEVEALSPPKEFLALDSPNISEHGLLNTNSLVLRVRHGKNVFLFPGDAYGAGQNYVMKTWKPEQLQTTVMAAPHHGFNASDEFVQATKPQIVVASCLSDYPANANTPHPRSPGEHATKVFGKVGSKVYVTAWHGTVQVTSDGETIAVKTERPPASSGGADK